MPSSESDRGNVTFTGPQTEGLSESFLKMTIDELTRPEGSSRGRARRRRKRWFSGG